MTSKVQLGPSEDAVAPDVNAATIATAAALDVAFAEAALALACGAGVPGTVIFSCLKGQLSPRVGLLPFSFVLA